jgi:hypothetical protein
MKLYEKPVVEVIDDVAEVVCADGSNEIVGIGPTDTTEATTAKLVCRFGRTEASKGSDLCQVCSMTEGTSNNVQQYPAYQRDYKGCPDSMPEKA